MDPEDEYECEDEDLRSCVSDSIEELTSCETAEELERIIFTAVNDGDRDALHDLFEYHPSPTFILQLLLTITYPNSDGFYKHDPEVLSDALELLGKRYFVGVVYTCSRVVTLLKMEMVRI